MAAIRNPIPLLAAVATLLTPAAACADFFTADSIDGPTAEIQQLGGIDVARDGAAVVTYTKRQEGVDHVYASIFSSGGWHTPQRLDSGLGTSSSQPAVSIGDGGLIVVTFVNGGALYTATKLNASVEWGSPNLIYSDAVVSNPRVDIGVNGYAYLVFAAASGSSDVRAARFDGTNWTLITDPLDVDLTRDAGDGELRRPRISVAADGYALAVWGEGDEIFARRLTGTTPSSSPQEVSLSNLGDHQGSSAYLPDLEIEDDSSFAWVVFRQNFDDGSVMRPRVIARRMLGSTFDPPAPQTIDSLSFPSSEGTDGPQIDMSGRGFGLAAGYSADTFGTFGAVLTRDVFDSGNRVDSQGSAGPTYAVPVVNENESELGAIAWQRDPGAGGARTILARHYEDGKFNGEKQLSRDEYGTTDASLGLYAAGDRLGDIAIAFIQGTDDSKRVVAAVYDRPPAAPRGLTTSNFQNSSQPKLKWRSAVDLWGTITYNVYIDGQLVGTTTDVSLISNMEFKDGRHKWKITAVDQRGQQKSSSLRTLKIDGRIPAGEILIRRSKRVVRAIVKAKDGGSKLSSGIKRIAVDFGDGSGKFVGSNVLHTYRSGGKKTITATITDRAGNVGTVVRDVAIGKKKKK